MIMVFSLLSRDHIEFAPETIKKSHLSLACR